MTVEDIWTKRRSVRGFTPDAVPPETLTKIFAQGQLAPSWCNIQPWRVVVTSPPKTRALAEILQADARAGRVAADVPFPTDYPEPYGKHRVACGVALYRSMGIARDDKGGRYGAWLRNYAFFDAPHVAIVACDRRLGPYAYVDVGVWLGYVLTAATEAGVATCAMASVAAMSATLREHLPIAETDAILFGLALGYEDPAAPANATRTTRDPVETNVTFV
jgi:nitroreductase